MFRVNNVDSILSVFTRIVNRLERLAAKRTAHAGVLREKISVIKNRHDSHIAEAAKADEAAKKIKCIFNI